MQLQNIKRSDFPLLVLYPHRPFYSFDKGFCDAFDETRGIPRGLRSTNLILETVVSSTLGRGTKCHVSLEGTESHESTLSRVLRLYDQQMCRVGQTNSSNSTQHFAVRTSATTKNHRAQSALFTTRINSLKNHSTLRQTAASE